VNGAEGLAPLDAARGEIAAAVRLVLPLGLAVTLGGYGLLMLKMQVFTLVLPTGSMQTLAGIACGFLLGTALLAAVDHGREMLLLALGHRLARGLAPHALRAAATQRGSGADASAAAAQVMSDVEELRRAASGPLAASALDALMVPVVLVMLMLIDARIAAFGLVAAVIGLGLGWIAERRTAGALRDSNAAAAETTGMVVDAMRCAEAVQAMGLMPALRRRWLARMAEGAGKAARRAVRGPACLDADEHRADARRRRGTAAWHRPHPRWRRTRHGSARRHAGDEPRCHAFRGPCGVAP
jgi:ABC-type protease/lipase transport system fused ATPase/permease subunit